MTQEDTITINKAIECLSDTRLRLLRLEAEIKDEEVKKLLQDAYLRTLQIAADLDWEKLHRLRLQSVK